MLLALACVLLVARKRLLGDQARFTSIGGRSSASRSVALGTTWRLVLAMVMGLYLLATTVAPLVALALSSVVSQLTPLIAPWHLLTGSNWSAIGHGQYSQSIVNTVEIAGIGAIATTALIGLATAVAHRSRFVARGSLPFTMLFPRAIPGIIIGIGFFWTFLLINPPGGTLRTSIWGLVLALSVRSLPLAYLVMSSAFATVSESLDDAARSAGASWWTAMRRIALPIVGSALFVSFVLLFISILNDYDPGLFLVTPGHEVMGVTMLQSLQIGTSGPAAAMAMVQVLVTLAAIVVGGRIFTTRMPGRARA